MRTERHHGDGAAADASGGDADVSPAIGEVCFERALFTENWSWIRSGEHALHGVMVAGREATDTERIGTMRALRDALQATLALVCRTPPRPPPRARGVDARRAAAPAPAAAAAAAAAARTRARGGCGGAAAPSAASAATARTTTRGRS